VIDQVFQRLGRRAQAADALWRRAEHTSIAFESGRLKAAGVSEESGINLRVLRNGRVGVAGTTATSPADLDSLRERALSSAELGEPLELRFPVPSSLPDVATRSGTAADASLERLIAIGRELVGRLSRSGCQVNVAVERTTGETTVGNTGGARGAYPSTAVAVTADLTRIDGDDVLMVYDVYTGTDLPAAADLEAIITSIEGRLDRALRVAEPPQGALPVVFSPAGLSAILLPLEQGLSGKAVLQGISPLAERVGAALFDARISLSDDPLVPGRIASRPIDDEGIPSATTCLVERGVVRRFVYDLETATRAHTTSTGHGHRSIFGKPRIAYSNLVIGGQAPTAAYRATGNVQRLGDGLLDGVDDGLLVDDLIGVGQGNVISGAFSHPVGLAYSVRKGEIVGRVKDAAVAGNVYDLLKKVGGFGTDWRWYGSRWSPSILLDGVSVARR
jgi:PmbA protein